MEPNCINKSAQLDRLSSLSDDILVDILNFLPNKTSVSTSVLSTRCRFLWTLINHINLDCRDFSRQTNEFYSVVYRLLFKISPPSLRSFALHVPYDGQPCLEHWLDYLCSQHNVEDVKISVEAPESLFDETRFSSFTMPRCVFQSNSLVCLNLGCSWLNYELPSCCDDDDVVVVSLPNLKKLALDIRASQCGFLARLLRSCPLLEDLSLSTGINWFLEERLQGDYNNVRVIDISCANLKRLCFNLFFCNDKDKLVIDAPKLVSFRLDASFLTSCSFVKKPISLHEAHISTRDRALLFSVVPAVMNVTVLHLFGDTFEFFLGFNPFIFHNLMELTLDLKADDNSVGWKFFQFETTSSNLLLHVKKINLVIYSYIDAKESEKLMEYLLTNATALKKLAFVIDSHVFLGPSGEDRLKYKLEEIILCMRARNASQCLFEFHGYCAKLPVNIAQV